MVGVYESGNGWGRGGACYSRCPVNIGVSLGWGGGQRNVFGTGEVRVCVRMRAGESRQSESHQSTSLRSLTGSSCTMLRWFMARLKAIWTALRMLDVRPSIILILSMVLSIPRGTILDLGSHCLRRGERASMLEQLHPGEASLSSVSLEIREIIHSEMMRCPICFANRNLF